MNIESQAPTRIDLSGGTLDIWPLYLFHQKSITINVAIDLYARVSLRSRKDKKIIIRSLDPHQEIEFSNLSTLHEIPGLELYIQVISFFKPKIGFEITAQCDAPNGSGLGGSSAMMIALVGAFNHLVGYKYKKAELILLGKNLEAKMLKLPTGEQDFYSALYGDLNCIHWGIEGVKREEIAIEPIELENRLILCYSGIPRLSVSRNWDVIKMHLDGDKRIFKLFEKLRDISLSMRKALHSKNYTKIEELFTQELQTRSGLPGKISDSLNELLNKSVKHCGALSAKICGAGGGGCFLFWIKPENKAKVIDCLKDERIEILNFKISPIGLEVKEH